VIEVLEGWKSGIGDCRVGNDWLGLTESFEDVDDDDLRIPGGRTSAVMLAESSSRACIL
jgi:hypothetical protein